MNDAVTEVQAEEAPVEETAAVTEVQTEETPTMEELLKEFDSGTDEPKEEPTQDEGDSRVDQIYHFMQEEQSRRTEQDINSAISQMKETEESISGLPDTMLRGYINEVARSNPSLVRAFAERHQKPGAWSNIVKAAAKDLGKQLSVKKEDKVTSDLASVRKAIEQSETKSNDGPTDADILKMSPAEFNEYCKKQGLASDVWG